MQSSDSFPCFCYHLFLYLFIFSISFEFSNILGSSITDETLIVEMHIWCRKFSTINVIDNIAPHIFGPYAFLAFKYSPLNIPDEGNPEKRFGPMKYITCCFKKIRTFILALFFPFIMILCAY